MRWSELRVTMSLIMGSSNGCTSGRHGTRPERLTDARRSGLVPESHFETRAGSSWLHTLLKAAQASGGPLQTGARGVWCSDIERVSGISEKAQDKGDLRIHAGTGLRVIEVGEVFGGVHSSLHLLNR